MYKYENAGYTVHNRWIPNPYRRMFHVLPPNQCQIHGGFPQSQHNLNRHVIQIILVVQDYKYTQTQKYSFTSSYARI